MEVPADWDAFVCNDVGREHHVSPGRALHCDPGGPSESEYRATPYDGLAYPSPLHASMRPATVPSSVAAVGLGRSACAHVLALTLAMVMARAAVDLLASLTVGEIGASIR